MNIKNEENMKTTKEQRVQKVKNFLQSTGAIAGAISGVAVGLLALIRVFYPDPKPTDTTQPSNGISEVK